MALKSRFQNALTIMEKLNHLCAVAKIWAALSN